MIEAIKTVKSYCKQIRQYINSEGPKPPNPPETTFKEIKEACSDTSVAKSKQLRKLKTLVDDTKSAVEKEIKTLNQDGIYEERFYTLNGFNWDLYQLHKWLHSDDVETVEQAHHLIALGIPKLMEKRKEDFVSKEWRLKIWDKFVKFLILITFLSAAVSAVFAIRNPLYTNLLLTYSLLCLTVFLWLENIWLLKIQDRLEESRAMADPTTATSAMNFLKKPQFITHLQTLFEDPSSVVEYQKEYINMLVDFGSACLWIEPKEEHIEAVKATMEEILNEAYSPSPTLYEPMFLESWRNTFEELQVEMRDIFGKNLKVFSKKTAKNPTYFLNCFSSFLKSETAIKLKSFIS